MEVVRIVAERRAEIAIKPDPQPKNEFVVVRVEVAPMCTEYKGWLKGWASERLGHEAAGVVESTDGMRRVRVGDRVLVLPQYPCGRCHLCLKGEYVYCEHSVDPLALTGNEEGTATYAQRLIKQDWMLVPIPDDVSTELASLANCALGPGYGALKVLDVNGEDTVLITGLGPVGLGAILMAKRRGARVIAAEPNQYRADLGRVLGADRVIDPNDPEALGQLRSLTHGEGVDKVIECAGAVPAQRFAVDAVRRRGAIAFVGEAGEFTFHVSNDFIRKGLTVHGSWYYNHADTVPLMRLIAEMKEDLLPLITHRFPMADVELAFALQATGNCGKVLLRP